MNKIECNLSRLGSATLSSFFDQDTILLLEALDLRNLASYKLAELLIRQIGEEDLLLNDNIRKQLIASLQKTDLLLLAKVLNLNSNSYDTALNKILSLNFRRGSSSQEKLHQFFGLEIPDEGISISEPWKKVYPGYGLFEHQRNACIEVNRYLSSENPRVVLHMPTGAGKTRTAMHIISQWLNSCAKNEFVIWLANTEELCEQAAQEFENAWASIGNSQCSIIRYFGSYSPDLKVMCGGIIIAGLQKLYQFSNSKMEQFYKLCDSVSLVVFDEAHQATAPTYRHLMNMLAPLSMDTAVLGLTATPGRTNAGVQQDQELAEFFFKQKVTLNVEGYETPIHFLEDRGYLAKITYEALESDIEISDINEVALRDGFDLPESVLKNLGNSQKRNLMLLKAIIHEARLGHKILVFACSVQHAELIANLLRTKAVTSASITSKTRASRRRDLVKKFKNDKEPQVLTNYGVLTTGFDAPKTNVAVIARPTSSVVLYSQMVGRAARGPKAGGTETCRVLTVVDKIPGFNLVDGFKFWEELWH